MIKNIDCLDGLKELSDNSVDTLITDPPYGISFMGKNWDTFNQIDDLTKNDHGSVLYKKGFKKVPTQSSKSMIEFFTPIWKEGLRVLKPGSFAFIMCIPRQDCLSRMIVSLDDVGFKTDFTSLYWAFGSGFPKASNISKSIDKKLGAKRKVIKLSDALKGRKSQNKESFGQHIGNENVNEYIDGYPITSPSTPQAKLMNGWYSFNPKPAVEIIIVAQKPLKHKSYMDQALDYSHQILHHQKKDIAPGCVNFDDCRIPYGIEIDNRVGTDIVRGYKKGVDKTTSIMFDDKFSKYQSIMYNQQGRFPANLLVSDDILNDNKNHQSGWKDNDDYQGHSVFGAGDVDGKIFGKHYSDSGSFSRYFSLDAWWNDKIKKLPESVQKTFPFIITPKASKSEKNKGCEGLPEKTTQGMRSNAGPALVGIDRKRTQLKNIHPCVKPVKLISYLLTLSTRENDTVLDPFIGSGTTAVACKMLNRKCIGFEISNEYYQIAKKRLQSCVTINDWI